MNRVICLAEDLDITVFYQDTDSMHLIQDDLPTLTREYKKKYKTELVGKDLSQFHEDFNVPADSDIQPYAIESIFLGKKAYYDKVVYKSDGSHVLHYRLKGIPSKAIEIYAEQHNTTVGALYKRLYKGKTIKFDLLAGSCRFVKNSDLTISSKECTKNPTFTREVKF